MATGLGALGLAPAHFWSMTPRELAAAFRGALGSSAPETPLLRSDFDTLSQRFPDH